MADRPHGMKHVDRDALYTDLSARVAYLKDFIGFGPDDLVTLERGQELVRQVIPDIVNSVYKRLLSYDVTARVFSTRDSRCDDDPTVWPQDGSPAIQNRKIFLRWYLTRLNQDPSKKEFWEYLDKVGQMHVGEGRRNPLHVDYMFLGICLGFVQDAITEAILTASTVELRLRISLVRALGKLLWIQNDLLARHHINEDTIGLRSYPGSSMASPVQQPQTQGTTPSSKFSLDTQSISTTSSHTGSETASYAGSNKTSLGRSREALETGGCPFSGSSMDDQRAGLGWPLSNGRSSSDRPPSRQRGWL
ncbi:hypothetical protein Q7P37_008429 [Cladosporium fusiforme]